MVERVWLGIFYRVKQVEGLEEDTVTASWMRVETSGHLWVVFSADDGLAAVEGERRRPNLKRDWRLF